MPRDKCGFVAKEQIERRAYEPYLQGGCKDGNDEENWLTAEKELTNKFAADVLPAKRVSARDGRRKRKEAATLGMN